VRPGRGQSAAYHRCAIAYTASPLLHAGRCRRQPAFPLRVPPQVYNILKLVLVLDFSFFAGVPGRPKYRTKNENRKTPKTRRKCSSFRNGLGTVPEVYEATTIAHRTPPALAVTMVGGTCGVFKTAFWPNIAFALPTISRRMGLWGVPIQSRPHTIF
jgi:hypothetical protein